MFDDYLPPAVASVLRRLVEAGFEAYLVGGCVRDMLRGQSPKDFDLATSARPEEVQRVFRRVIPTGIAHGTVTVVEQGTHVEVTTFRAEGGYLDGRRPSSVEFHTDIEADLSRRDFTINAMAWRPGSTLVDPFGGQNDLSQKVVRCVRNAQQRFEEDGLRALRAVRFATVLDFSLDPATESAIEPTLPIVRKVALERVKDELVKVIRSPRAAAGIALMSRTGLLHTCWPEAVAAHGSALSRCPERLDVRLAVLWWGQPAVREGLLRLKFSSAEAEETAALTSQPPWPESTADDAVLRRFLAAVTPARLDAAVAVRQALGLATEGAHRLVAIAAQNPPLTAKQLALDGKAIMATLGVGPSPQVGEATRWLVAQVIEEPARNTPDGLRECLARWPR